MKRNLNRSYIKAISMLFVSLFLFCACNVYSGTNIFGLLDSAKETSASQTTTVKRNISTTESSLVSSQEKTSKITQSAVEATTFQTIKKEENITKPIEKTTLPAKTQNSLPYYIKVNKQANCITIYEKGNDGAYTVPVKAMVCSTGDNTPLGTFHTLNEYRWRLLIHDVWGQYATRITRDILFHSVPYDKKNPETLLADEYNKLGESASAGCVRVTVADAKWIQENCPIGTTVTIYNSEDPGPLGKPQAQKIPSDSKWDPTDLDERNPWNLKEEITMQMKP